jgi:hypothetical protein
MPRSSFSLLLFSSVKVPSGRSQLQGVPSSPWVTPKSWPSQQ